MAPPLQPSPSPHLTQRQPAHEPCEQRPRAAQLARENRPFHDWCRRTASCSQLSDLIPVCLSEPDRPVGTCGYARGTAVLGRNHVLRDDAIYSDACNLVRERLGKPKLAVIACDDPLRSAERGRDVVL